jgi:hypothetical protein
MNMARKALYRAGLTGAVVTAALTVTLTAAGTAGAERVNGGYYTYDYQCYQAGSNAVELGHARDYNCAYSATHVPHWHLILFT